MIPAVPHPSVRSSAEKRMFHVIEDAAGSNDWVCLHSLGLARHQRKRRAEIDFLLITPQGALVLEVKGGRVSRIQGRWSSVDRYGTRHALKESPFEQASTAMFSLERTFKEEFHGTRLAQLLLGYGVVVPDVVLDSLGTEAEEVLYDRRDRSRPFAEYVARALAFARASNPPRVAPRRAERERLVEYLRGDFDLVPTIATQADNVLNELVRLTREQYQVLDVLDRVPRVVCEGSAGTGKTLLALEAARRHVRRRRSTLLLCFNRQLAAHMRGVAGTNSSDLLTIDSIHHVMTELIAGSSLKIEFEAEAASATQDEVFSVLQPHYAALAMMEGVRPPWEVLVLDEGQDVLTADYLDFLDVSVDGGGLETGRWAVFLDSNNQAAVYGRFDNRAFQRLLCFGQRVLLTTNCRNTREISHEAEMLSRPEVTASARVSGSPVDYRWYASEGDQVRHINEIVTGLLASGVDGSRVAILSARSLAKSVLRTRLAFGTCRQGDGQPAGKTGVRLSTISAFKGLEADFVVLVDIEELESDWWRSILYVGMSRARTQLFVLMPKHCRPSYEAQLGQFLRSSTSQDAEEAGR